MSTDEESEPKRPAPAGPAGPICWPIYSDQDEQRMLAAVAEWVAWVRWRFTLDHRTIPTCWMQHGPVVEELSALHTAWQAAYSDGDGTAPLVWMCHFAAARERLTDWVARTGCPPGEHRERRG
jgi:hypothetical protein